MSFKQTGFELAKAIESLKALDVSSYFGSGMVIQITTLGGKEILPKVAINDGITDKIKIELIEALEFTVRQKADMLRAELRRLDSAAN